MGLYASVTLTAKLLLQINSVIFVMMSLCETSLLQVNNRVNSQPIINAFISELIKDIMTPCRHIPEASSVGHISQIIGDISYTQRHRLPELIHKYNNERFVFSPLPKDTDSDIIWDVPRPSIILNKYYNLSMMAFMLKVASIEEATTFGTSHSFKGHYERLYDSVMEILCGLQGWLAHHDSNPLVKEVRRRLNISLNKKHSLSTAGRNIKEIDQLYRLHTLQEALTNLYIDLDYIRLIS